MSDSSLSRRKWFRRRLIGVLGLAVALGALGVAPFPPPLSLAAGHAHQSQAQAAQKKRCYKFDTGPVVIHRTAPNYWDVARAQGSFCGTRPLGQRWHVWGSFVQYFPKAGEGPPLPHLNPTPANGYATFNRQGKLVSRSLHFPWFVQTMRLRLAARPPKVAVTLWQGQAVFAKTVTVTLVTFTRPR